MPSIRRSHPVDPSKELVIVDPSVIASRIETEFDPSRPSGTSRAGAWSFGRLIHNMLPRAERGSAAGASRLVFRWLQQWETNQTPNPEVSPAFARPAIRMLITQPVESGERMYGSRIAAHRRCMRP